MSSLILFDYILIMHQQSQTVNRTNHYTRIKDGKVSCFPRISKASGNILPAVLPKRGSDSHDGKNHPGRQIPAINSEV